MSSTFELTVSRVIPASRKEVFEAWLSPVTLHHVGFPSEESRTNHEGGWGRILETLGKRLG